METDVECLYCTRKFDSKITIMKTLDEVKKHLKEDHPDKPQF